MRGNPALPRAVAEYYEAEARRHADPATRLEQELPGVQSLLELHTLAADELFRHWLAGRSARRQVERLAVDGHISHRTAEIRASRDFRMYRYVVIGVLPDGDELAHVLYRHDVDSEKPLSGGAASWLANLPDDEQLLARQLWASGHPSVALFRRQPDGSWRLIVEHDFLQIGSIQITGVIVDDKPKDGEEQ
jgi:hypothetical protein